MDDNNLITLLQQGDRNAYKQLFIKYYSPLCEYASQYISDDDSEKLVQELMLFLWETRENLVIETSLKSYLFISTKHRCLNAIRKNQYHERIHNQIYEKIKDQFEDPDYYFVNWQKTYRKRSRTYPKPIGKHLPWADSGKRRMCRLPRNSEYR